MAEPFRVGFVPGVSPGKWLRTWADRLPDSPLEPRLVEVPDQGELLVGGELDMCFVRLPVDRDGFHVIPLYAEVPVVVAAKDHPATAFDELDVGDLGGEHLLQDSATCPEWAAVADEVRDGTRVEPPPMTLAQAIEVAASGAGIVIVPMSLARLHQRKDVRYRPVTGVAQSQVGLAWLVDNEDPRVETFIGIVRGRTPRSSRDDDGARRAGGDGGNARGGGDGTRGRGGGDGARGRDSGRGTDGKQPGSRRGQSAGGNRRRGSTGPGPRRGGRRR